MPPYETPVSWDFFAVILHRVIFYLIHNIYSFTDLPRLSKKKKKCYYPIIAGRKTKVKWSLPKIKENGKGALKAQGLHINGNLDSKFWSMQCWLFSAICPGVRMVEDEAVWLLLPWHWNGLHLTEVMHINPLPWSFLSTTVPRLGGTTFMNARAQDGGCYSPYTASQLNQAQCH